TNNTFTNTKYKKFINTPYPPELSDNTYQPSNTTPNYSQPDIPDALNPHQYNISSQNLPSISK
ncbi:hypothetical protein, partial [Klebsiella pneumoniae]|uniref:hypothetical protein n=1 Tax=Klebsiella pneumoniae TaxID=573 RepID=UPI0019523C93